MGLDDACVHARVHACECASVCTCVHAHSCAHLYMYTHVHLYTHVNPCTHKRAHVHTRVHVCACVCALMPIPLWEERVLLLAQLF